MLALKMNSQEQIDNDEKHSFNQNQINNNNKSK